MEETIADSSDTPATPSGSERGNRNHPFFNKGVAQSSSWAITWPLDEPDAFEEYQHTVHRIPDTSARGPSYLAVGSIEAGVGDRAPHVHCMIQSSNVCRKAQAVRWCVTAMRDIGEEKSEDFEGTPGIYCEALNDVTAYIQYMVKKGPTGALASLVKAAADLDWAPKWSKIKMGESVSVMDRLERALVAAQDKFPKKPSYEIFKREVTTLFGIAAGRYLSIIKNYFECWVEENVARSFKAEEEDRALIEEEEITDDQIRAFGNRFVDWFMDSVNVESSLFGDSNADDDILALVFLTMWAMRVLKRPETPSYKKLQSLWIWADEQAVGKSMLTNFICGEKRRTKKLVTDATGVGRWRCKDEQCVITMDDLKQEFVHMNTDYSTLISFLDGESPEVKVFGASQSMDPMWVVANCTWNILDEKMKIDGEYTNTRHHFHRRFLSLKLRNWDEGYEKEKSQFFRDMAKFSGCSDRVFRYIVSEKFPDLFAEEFVVMRKNLLERF